VEVPNIHGFGLAEKMVNSQHHSGTYFWNAVQTLQDKFDYDRIIAFTDEQAHDDPVQIKKGKLYINNVASAKNGIAYQSTIHINGFSEKVINFIAEYEKEEKK
jgi:hypothetical protein